VDNGWIFIVIFHDLFMISSILLQEEVAWFFFLDDGVTGDIPQLSEQEKGSFKSPYSEKKVKEAICKWSIIRPLDQAGSRYNSNTFLGD
jgi:hypothetical protein